MFRCPVIVQHYKKALVVGTLSLILAIVVLISKRFPTLIRGFDITLTDFVTENKSVEHCLRAIAVQAVGKKVATVCAWVVGFFVLIYLVGYLIAIPAFILLSVKIHGHIRWLNTLLCKYGTYIDYWWWRFYRESPGEVFMPARVLRQSCGYRIQ